MTEIRWHRSELPKEVPAPTEQVAPPEQVAPHRPKQMSDGGSSDYYKLPEGASDLTDLIEDKDMGFHVGNIFKACYRLGRKAGNDDAYDLRKIRWSVDREMKRLGIAYTDG